MPQNRAKHLATLPKATATQLRALWHELYGPLAPPPIRKGLLARALAYRIQEKAFGAPVSQIRRRIRKLIEQTNEGVTLTVLDTPTTKPGTRLIRQWHGDTHEVTVVNAGYLYRGRRYESLSAIASLITGNRRSGPLFFGLKSVAQDKEVKHSHER